MGYAIFQKFKLAVKTLQPMVCTTHSLIKFLNILRAVTAADCHRLIFADSGLAEIVALPAIQPFQPLLLTTIS